MDWSKLTANFSWSEFFDPAKSGDVTKNDTIKAFFLAKFIMQPLRDHLKAPIIITSGKRSASHNKKIGGATRSDHLFREECAACDFTLQDKNLNRKAFKWLVQNKAEIFGQLIKYDDGEIVRWIHVSLSSRKHSGEAFTIKLNKEGKTL